MTARSYRATLAWGLVLAGAACTPEPEASAPATDGDPAAAAAADPSGTAAMEPAPASDGATPFRERAVVFLEASPEDIEAVRAGTPPQDFLVIADDLMFYRASAYEFFESRGFPVTRVEGRRPLEFEVGGQARTYAFDSLPTLDLIVLYEPGREPLPLAPVDALADTASVFQYFRPSEAR